MSGARRAVVEPTTIGDILRGWVGQLLLDGTAILALLALVACAFWPVYATGWLFVTVLGFGALGMAVAIVSIHRGLKVGVTALLATGGWFLFGGFLAMPSSCLLWVIPTPRTLFGLLVGPVTAWRDMLTLDPPIGETFNLLTVPGLLSLVVALVAMTISQRGNTPGWAWLPLAGALAVGILVGSRVAFAPFSVGAAFFLIVLGWTSYRRAASRARLSGSGPRFRPVRLAAGIGTLLTGLLTALLLTPIMAGSAERDNLRAVMEPPIDLSEYASPLQAYRANITERRETTLFRVSGINAGDVVRLATLDKYDGVSYRVGNLEDQALRATTFTRVGQWIADAGAEPERDSLIDIAAYEGVWVPTVGRTTSIRFEGTRAIGLGENFYYNRGSATGFVSTGLTEGDRYELRSKVPERPADEDIARAEAGSYVLPPATGVPDEVETLADTWAEGARTAGAAALQIERALQAGYFSHGQPDEAKSLPGHTENRISTLLRDTNRMVGDHEQYAVAMALMARELGIPARVIYGYKVEATNILGDNVGAWPELYLQGLGWVMFDPTPPETRILDEDLPKQPPDSQPFIENPPPPPQRPEMPPPDEMLPIDPGEAPDEERRINWAQLGVWFALTGIPLITIVGPIAVIVGLKLRRRKRRREHPVMANRIAGAWAELVDHARDLGRSPSVSATRSEQAESLMENFPKVVRQADPISLARQADWLVFAPGEPSQKATDGYWDASGAIKRGMQASVTWVRWVLSRLSTKSFRRVR